MNKKITLSFVIGFPVALLLIAYLSADLKGIVGAFMRGKVFAGNFGGTVAEIENANLNTNSVHFSAFENLSSQIFGFAEKLQIQTLGIDLNLIKVGVAADGSLETPKKWNEGGWFADGTRPGEPGNVIINAHYDDNYGRPAGFWYLKNIKEGDKVFVVDNFGRFFTYRVEKKFYLDINDPDRLKIFSSDTTKRELTLITCGGVWLSGSFTYSQRLIVKAELVKE